MINYTKRCKVCKAVKENKKLLKRIYDSKAYIPSSKDSLRRIHLDHKGEFSYESLRNHCDKHQFISEEDFDKKELEQIDQKYAQDAIKKAISHSDVRKTVMDIGHKEIEEGKIKLSANHVLTAARDQANWEDKQKDRQVAMMEMVWHFSSGANYDSRVNAEPQTGDQLPAGEPAEDYLEGQTGPGGVYYPPAWNAAPPRPSEILEGDDQTQNQD